MPFRHLRQLSSTNRHNCGGWVDGTYQLSPASASATPSAASSSTASTPQSAPSFFRSFSLSPSAGTAGNNRFATTPTSISNSSSPTSTNSASVGQQSAVQYRGTSADQDTKTNVQREKAMTDKPTIASEKESVKQMQQGGEYNNLRREHDGPKGPEPTRYNDWERKGRVYDF